MKINVICPDCSTGGIAKFTLQVLRDDSVYVGSCAQGHELVVVTQTLRHELLFEIALNAIRDGYYREAVASFAASTERFFEFAIRVMCRLHSIEPDLFARTWSLVQGSSERQLGAYHFTQLTLPRAHRFSPKRWLHAETGSYTRGSSQIDPRPSCSERLLTT
jgi:hypothetical protein